MTPEQKFALLANIINFGIAAAVVWVLFCDHIVEPFLKRLEERIRRKYES